MSDEPLGPLPTDWGEALGAARADELLQPVARFVGTRRRAGRVLPDPSRVFAALEATPYASVRAVILGQDPYPRPSFAMGLAFSVPRDVPAPFPGSLRNIRDELQADLGVALPGHGSLESWARHGVLLLNTILTVDEGVPGSHEAARWQAFTDAIIEAVSAKGQPVAFLLWGRKARSKAWLIDPRRHVIVESAHPSPLSAWRGFRNSQPFSGANTALASRDAAAIDWSLDDAPGAG